MARRAATDIPAVRIERMNKCFGRFQALKNIA